MALAQHAQKRTAQNLNNLLNSTPKKTVQKQSKQSKDNRNETKEKEEPNLQDLYNMMKIMMTKLDKLDDIQERMESMDNDLKSVKQSLEYTQAEVSDLKTENDLRKDIDKRMAERIEILEKDNERLNNSVIDLRARSMRDNLVFYNIKENAKENTTEIIHKLLEEKFNIQNASEKVKIDRSHRIGKPRRDTEKPRPIVAKFNFYPDKVNILRNAKKLAGTNIGISEKFPVEIIEKRKKLLPEYKKAKAANKKAKLVYDKLIIEGQVFHMS